MIVGDRGPDRLIDAKPFVSEARVYVHVRYSKNGVVVKRNTSFKPASLVKIHDRQEQ